MPTKAKCNSTLTIDRTNCVVPGVGQGHVEGWYSAISRQLKSMTISMDVLYLRDHETCQPNT